MQKVNLVDPAIIFEGVDGLRDEWLRDLEVGKYQIFCCSTPSRWSNNDLALASVDQVFDRCTKEKAKRDYKMLLVDGHGNHLTPSFIEYCHAHEEYHSTAVIWSPRSVREARAREAVEQQQEHGKKLQKRHQREERAAAAVYKKQLAQAAREPREMARVVRQEERDARAAQLAAARAQKAEDCAAATTQKSRDRQNTAKRKASLI
ncbi:hypothetical protein COCVIDRAFT_115788 [Bipolaris victoriae FI3]|uniref:DDE-1 domain-containing protein n=1 Tax=Bipolaris victoriae (strain FI3) TaxID=930091 RepID=W7DR61_BIPV3|nr:hypothetical protein COCVIDRAFT_115788 [Bipolaris victoriae FI3]